MSALQLESVYDEVAKCNKCGFCQAACPVYRVTGKEMLVARGHHEHVRQVIEGNLELGPALKEPLFDCLLCKACTANCPPAVDISSVMVTARGAYAERHGRSAIQSLLLDRVLGSRAVMGAGVKLLALGVDTGLARLAGATGALSLLNRDLSRAQNLVRHVPFRSFTDRAPRINKGKAETKRRVGYFVGCGVNYLLPEVAESTVRVLTRNGVEVVVLRNYCCGLPAVAYGDFDAARSLARKNIDLFREAGVDTVITDCGSCSSFLKEYAGFLAEDAEYAQAAEQFTAGVRDVNQFLAEDIDLTNHMQGLNVTVTYHDPCHLSRYQKVTAQPRELLRKLPHVTFKELPEADWCCGAGGTFNLTHYDQSMAILDRKMGRVQGTGATILATSCPSCMLQLSHGVREKGLNVKVRHVTQLLDEAYGGTAA